MNTNEVPDLTESIAHYIACELSHDIKEGLWERVRWNNRVVAMVLASRNKLLARLDAIKRCWQDGVGQLDNPWRLKMAELVGDVEGLAEAKEQATATT